MRQAASKGRLPPPPKRASRRAKRGASPDRPYSRGRARSSGAAIARRKAHRVRRSGSDAPPRRANGREVQSLGLRRAERSRPCVGRIRRSSRFAPASSAGSNGLAHREARERATFPDAEMVRLDRPGALRRGGSRWRRGRLESAFVERPARIEVWAAIDLEPFEEIAGETAGRSPCSLIQSERLNSRIDRRRDVDRVHVDSRPRRSAILSSDVSTLRRFGSSRIVRSLLRHQRSSPRGSFGTSHSRSQRLLRPTAPGANARYAKSPRTLRDAGSSRGTPSREMEDGPAAARKRRRSRRLGPVERNPRSFPRRLLRLQLPACSIIDWTASRFGRPRERRSVRHAELQNRQGGH